MVRVGLSGGIGSGKSTVAGHLRDLGGVIIDSDVIAREVLAPGSPGLAQVVTRFGDHVLDAQGALDRPALGRIVFVHEPSRRDLEAITHPLIARRTAELFEKAGAAEVVVHDVPLLVEKNMGSGYDVVVMVHVNTEERLRRLVEDRGMSEAEARSRIASQAGDDARRAAADIWLDNNGTPEELKRAVANLWSEHLKPDHSPMA
ncbi:MAG: dephospho-CoA kinase [Ornithinimicrobium sp.]